LISIHPAELHDVWPWVQEGLLKVKKKTQADWIPEDVYSAIRNGTSTLHLGNQDEGFLVLTPRNDWDCKTLFIWIAYGEGNVYEKYLPEIEQIAKSINARRIRFESSRKGWGKRFDYVTSIFEKEL
jgi:hypothetical protein